MKPAFVAALRLLAIGGFLISAYLLSQKLLGKIDSIAGCGAGSGCANVLGSRWSAFFLVPVTAFSSLLYAVLFGTTFAPAGALRPLRAGLAVCFTGAALWFFGILLFELKAFCPWCSAAHAIGLTSAILLALSLRRDPAEAKKGNAHFGIAGGVLAVFVLILGQLFGPAPKTYRITTGGSMQKENEETSIHSRPGPSTPGDPAPGSEATPSGPAAPGDPAPEATPPKGRVVNIFDDNKSYNTATLPHLGPADAPHVIAKYFDYTCASCKDMHEDLHLVAEKHPGAFCMIMLPVPLNRACNPHFPANLENHEHACELARLSLAAWRADPGSWPEVHETLFTRPVLQPEIAEIAVAQIVGEEALAKGLADPWVDELITADCNDFRQLMEIGKTPKMPKLVVGRGRLFHGITNTATVLLRALEMEFKLDPAPLD